MALLPSRSASLVAPSGGVQIGAGHRDGAGVGGEYSQLLGHRPPPTSLIDKLPLANWRVKPVGVISTLTEFPVGGLAWIMAATSPTVWA